MSDRETERLIDLDRGMETDMQMVRGTEEGGEMGMVRQMEQ